jgi:thiol-disulfide isomerase/thioredoxin
MKNKRKIWLISFASIFTLFFLYLILNQVRKESNPIQQTVPNFYYKNSKGDSVFLEQLRGKVILINFWAYWCDPCVEEMPDLKGLEAYFQNKDFTLIALHADRPDFDIINKFGLKFFPKNLIYEFSGDILEYFHINQLPTSILIDKKGVVQKRFVGPYPWLDPTIEDLIAQYIDEK